MRTAVDGAVLVEVFEGVGPRARASAHALKEAYAAGPLVVNEATLATVRSRFKSQADFEGALGALGLRLDPTLLEAATLAGVIWGVHGKHKAKARLEECLLGAHALVQADRLLTRKGALYKRLCPRLRVLVP